MKTNAFGGDGATARKGIILDENEYMYLFDIPLLQLANFHGVHQETVGEDMASASISASISAKLFRIFTK